ncbi:DUF2572 family protein [Gallibacterium melopsittaci]|uniref:DUF2572 family protein n=1 Tax=Gallibacterium melopsittaci TaxID=516063 RepID=A0ABV6HUT7_9PAST
MKSYQRGYINLLAILVLSSLSLLLLWLMQDSQLSYQRNLSLRKHYLMAQGELFKQYQQNRSSLCQPEMGSRAFSEILVSRNVYVPLQHSLDCVKESLFLNPLTAAQNAPRSRYLNPDYAFVAHQAYAEPVYNTANQPLLWLIDQDTEWQLNGNLYGVVISNAKLTVQGKGQIIGAVISDQPITIASTIKIRFNQAVIQKIEQQFSRWQIAEGGWHDF